MKKSRQEEAFEFVFNTFYRLIEGDKRTPNKQIVLAMFQDLFGVEEVRSNMVQAFSNFLFEIDDKIDAARKAGIDQLRTTVILEGKRAVGDSGFMSVRTIDHIASNLLESENSEEETIEGIENMDLTEVGGGDEDDTPIN